MQAFGDRLKKERERRGVTLEEMAQSTKITTRMLRALEQEQFDQLPGGIFNKGFVRAYARHLGIDEDEAVAGYLATVASQTAATTATTTEAAPAVQPIQVHAEAEPPAVTAKADLIPWGKLALALLLIAFGFAVWGSFSRQPGERHKAAAISTVPSAPNAGAVAAADNSEAAGAVTPGAVPAEAAPQTAAPTEAPPAPQDASPAPAQTETAPAFLVLVQARQDSWVEITADGKEVMQDTLAAASQKSVEARKEVVIRVGNVGGLEFSFNGRKLPVQGDHNEVRVLTFDSNGLQNPVSRRPRPDTRGRRPEV